MITQVTETKQLSSSVDALRKSERA